MRDKTWRTDTPPNTVGDALIIISSSTADFLADNISESSSDGLVKAVQFITA